MLISIGNKAGSKPALFLFGKMSERKKDFLMEIPLGHDQ